MVSPDCAGVARLPQRTVAGKDSGYRRGPCDDGPAPPSGAPPRNRNTL